LDLYSAAATVRRRSNKRMHVAYDGDGDGCREAATAPSSLPNPFPPPGYPVRTIDRLAVSTAVFAYFVVVVVVSAAAILLSVTSL